MTPILVSVLGAIIALVLLLVVFELIRRYRLQERYALLWIATALVLLVLSVARGTLDSLAHLLGIAYAPALLFAVIMVFAIVMLLHYSTVISRLATRNTELAQASALLEERVRRLEAADSSGRDPAPDLD
jgi:hypothetical protein